MNPERLSARGRNAREERKREEGMHTRVRNLEKITKKVLNLVTSWEETNGHFFYAGERYADRVAEQEANILLSVISSATRAKGRTPRARRGQLSSPSRG